MDLGLEDVTSPVDEPEGRAEELAPATLTSALSEHEQRVDEVIKVAAKYNSALKAWKKACQTGHMANRQKAAAEAERIVHLLQEPTREVAGSWSFDVRAYLDGDSWRSELQSACAAAGIRVFEEGKILVAPPVLVQAQPGQTRLLLGKAGWPALHPKVTAAALKKLNEKSSSSAALQQFVNALYEGCKRVSKQGDLFAKFRDIYDLFACAPGWKRENSPTSFAQQIYALHRSDVHATGDGHTFEIEYPSGKQKEADIFGVISEDGRPIRYYGIWFR